MPERYFVSCPRGLEAVLESELAALGGTNLERADGGVGASGDFALAYRANLWSRVASRVLWRVGQGRYRDEKAVHALARGIDWPRHFRGDRTLRVDVAATRSPLASLEFATLTVKDAIVDRFRGATGSRPSVDKRMPDVRVAVHLTADTATFYLDTSGEPLFKRGYRRDTEEAPLRENLAAGLVALTGWTPGQAFLDPMCGSGTLAIEAALIAAHRAPGLTRTFGFQKLAWYDGPTWQRTKQAARDQVAKPPATPAIFASDIADTAIARARSNMSAAQVGDFIALERADALTRAAPAAAGTLLANPPYGVRLADRDRIAAMYPQFGDALKQRFTGWTAWLFTADTALPKLIHLKADKRIPLFNGALECRLYRYGIQQGPMLK
ncbi:MAG: class I SAM-dependent RNA methyltransferase [Proteobacteria bacterium]|nr:class I SAM-dependent RNA methyltransferase [Pseudomonadota bacterium]